MILEDELLLEMTKAVKAVFDACRAETKDADLVGFAICLDDTGTMFSPVTTSQSHITSAPEAERLDYKYNPENWRIQAGVEEADEVWNKINDFYEQCEDYDYDDDWHEEFRSRIYQLAVRTLENLRRNGYFGTTNSNDLFITAWVVDSDVPYKRATSWVKRLNSASVQHGFVEWLDLQKEHREKA